MTQMTQAEMRAAEVPTLNEVEQLRDYIAALLNQEHDYGTCVYAMSMAATAAFNLVASQLGVSGFQASCADMDILRRTRRIDGPFMLVDLGNALYPQYDLVGDVEKAIKENRSWLATRACEELAKAGEHVAPRVVEHWKKLAEAA